MCFFNNEGDPVLDFRAKSIWKHFKESPWISSNKFVVLRIILFLLNLLYQGLTAYIRTAQALKKFHQQQVHAIPNWIYILRETIPEGLVMYLHTILVCHSGLDVLYLTHVTSYAIDYILVVFAKIAYIYDKIVNGQPFWHAVIKAMVYMIVLISLIFWNISTRLLYVKQFREAIRKFKGKYSEIYKRLMVPWCVMLGLTLLHKGIKITFMCQNSVSIWFNPRAFTFGRLSTNIIESVLGASYELYMYFVIDHKKQNSNYIFGCKKTLFEHVYISFCGLGIILAIATIIFEFLNLEVKPGTWTHELYFWIYTFVYLILAARWIGLWYYALDTWKVTSLSWNALETEMNIRQHMKSSTFTGFFYQTGDSDEAYARNAITTYYNQLKPTT